MAFIDDEDTIVNLKWNPSPQALAKYARREVEHAYHNVYGQRFPDFSAPTLHSSETILALKEQRKHMLDR